MREAEGVEEFLVPAAVRTRAIHDGSGDVRLALDIDARVDAAALAAGGRLPSGRYVLRTVMHVAGFRFGVPVTRGRRAMLLTLAVDDRGRAKPARPTLKQALAAWAPGIRGLIVRAKQSLRR
jgi:hypothetical protein